MDKKFWSKLGCTLALSTILILNGATLVLATDPPAGGSKGADTPANGGNPTVDELLPSFILTTKPADNKGNYTADTKAMQGTKIGAVAALPKADWQTALGFAIRTMLNIAGGLTLLALTVGGAMMVLSGGQAALLDKGKKIVIYAIMGLIIMAVAYAVVIGVSELQFFPNAATSGSPNTAAPAAATPGATNGGGSAGTVPPPSPPSGGPG
jgi:hypothetical protein